MTVARSTFIVAAAAVALTGFAVTFEPDTALAFRDGRAAECDWYRRKAMSLGRKVNKAESQRYWQLHSDCMRYKID